MAVVSHAGEKRQAAPTVRAGGWERLLRAVGPPLLFLLLSAAFLWQPLLTGRVFLPTDLSYRYDYLWKMHEDDPGLTVAQNPLLSDVSDYYDPYADFAVKRLRAGHFPLWNPYIMTGTPFFASAQAAVLDPINLLTYLAGPLRYWTWGAWLRLALIGFTTYGFLRALGRGAVGGIAAGVVFMASGFTAVWLNYSVVTVLAWLPGLFWATTRLLQTGRAVWLAWTAFTMGALLVGGHPETEFLCGIMWGTYSLYAIFAAYPGPLKRGRTLLAGMGLLAGAATLGILVGVVQALPMLEFMLGSDAFTARAGAPPSFDLGLTAMRLGVLFFPNFTGTPPGNTYWVAGTLTNFNEQTGYIGLLALGLAVLGTAAYWRQSKMVRFFAVWCVLGVLLAVQAPGFHLIKTLPLFSVGHGVRWVIVSSFFGAVLAGYGLEAVAGMRPRTQRLRDAGLWLASGALLAFAALLAVYLGVRDGYWDLIWGAKLGHAEMARLLYPTRLGLQWPVVFMALGALLVLARWRGLLGRASLSVLLITLLYADLWTFGSRYNPVTPANEVFPPTEATRFLSDNLDHYRLAATINLLRPNVGMTFGFRDLRGYEDLVDQPFAEFYGNFYDANRTPVFDVSRKQSLLLTGVEQRQLNMAAVRYVLTVRKPRVDGDPRPYRFVLQEGRVALYENLQALPRAYVVFGARIRPDFDGAVALLRSSQFDPSREVVLDRGRETPPPPALNAGGVPVVWQKDEPEEVQLQTTLPAAGWLVLSDNYAQGWEAELDGRPVPLLRGMAVFRAVSVPAGSHTVAFYYRPRLFYTSALISALALALVLTLGMWSAVRKR